MLARRVAGYLMDNQIYSGLYESSTRVAARGVCVSLSRIPTSDEAVGGIQFSIRQRVDQRVHFFVGVVEVW